METTTHSHGGHRSRVRQEFLMAGLDSFPDHKALEMLLYPVCPRVDTNPLAHRLIETFGSFSAVLDAPYEELIKVKGIGESAAVLIRMITGLGRKYLKDKEERGIVLDNTETIGNYLMSRFIGVVNETVILVCLDSKNKVILSRAVMEGSVHATAVSTRLIAETALRSGCTKAVVAHNHPNGLAIPSNADLVTTRKLITALELIGIQLIDHIIVADGDFVSLAQSGSFSGLFRK